MRGPSVERLRRLRWRLTAIFTVMNTIGLIVLAPLVIIIDGNRRTDAADNELRVVTAPVLRLLTDTGAINSDRVNNDTLANECPEFAVLPGGATPFAAIMSRKKCTPMADSELAAIATDAVSSGQRRVVDSVAINGDPVRVLAEPFLAAGGNKYAGAVLAWTDLKQQNDDHNRLVLAVLASCAVLLGAAALIGYWLSGRAIRPALAALEQQEVLLAETAHDLRTPVAALRALAETAAQDPTQRAELLPRTVRLAGRMGDIIDGLLVRARLAAGVEQLTMQPVWLDQLVAGVVEDTPAGAARISVVTAPTKVRADPVLLQRAIGNLLDNAMRHGRAPGAAQAIVTVTVADGRVTVADQGPGVDPAIGEDVFERFSSGGGSSGLGLSIVRWVALSHGGDLKVHNADEGGAIFEFRIPVAADG
ncbi:sensor histidine kinase [Kribbella sp. CA-293567]|uniref:sensor histidine kinase n=1 Tax=Kribbella sp. CA-293567 TaxID=3002436 RepID=UPI0022DE2BC6|nr:HAMP domain-containing sensor histidine kinase [Kribbella sp. CA-293567]WBQ08422.1 HAMP domain-containing sensor histidine kinase [Kribbella sp. CA-293567]